MERRGKGEMWNKRNVSRICCLLLLALLQIITPSSAQNSTTVSPISNVMALTLNPAAVGYQTRPVSITVANGESAVFFCGVLTASPNLTFTYYGSKGTYSLTCPYDYVEAIPQVLYGQCKMNNIESLAIWILNKASLSDNGTQVVCKQPNNSESPAAVLQVYSVNKSTIFIGWTLGAFFGTILVFGLLYVALQKSEAFQKCFRGKETEDDVNTIVTSD